MMSAIDSAPWGWSIGDATTPKRRSNSLKTVATSDPPDRGPAATGQESAPIPRGAAAGLAEILRPGEIPGPRRTLAPARAVVRSAVVAESEKRLNAGCGAAVRRPRPGPAVIA